MKAWGRIMPCTLARCGTMHRHSAARTTFALCWCGGRVAIRVLRGGCDSSVRTRRAPRYDGAARALLARAGGHRGHSLTLIQCAWNAAALLASQREDEMIDQKWPQRLWIVRHGQSAGNLARDAAESGGLPLIDIATRDMDVALSPLGEQQARALGRWIAALPPADRPSVVLCSPYVRARATAELVLHSSGTNRDEIAFIADERLREKEFGILDRLTHLGIRQKYPELSEQRRH